MKVPMFVEILVNPKKRTVIAKFTEKSFDLAGYMDKHKTRQVTMIDMDTVKLDDLIGKAVAAPGEVFDEHKGAAIAEARLMKKFHKRCQNALSSHIQAVIQCQNELLKFEREFGCKVHNCAEKISHLTV